MTKKELERENLKLKDFHFDIEATLDADGSWSGCFSGDLGIIAFEGDTLDSAINNLSSALKFHFESFSMGIESN